MRDNKGFSLIELVVVMAIIAILTTIGIFVYNDIIDRAKYTELCADIKIYERAAHSAIVDLGTPDVDIIWGDSNIENNEWAETNWLGERINDGILVTITKESEVEVSFLEENENYDEYMNLLERFG